MIDGLLDLNFFSALHRTKSWYLDFFIVLAIRLRFWILSMLRFIHNGLYHGWGYKNLAETREHWQVTNMRQANIPLEGRLRSYRHGYYVFLCSFSDFPIAVLIVVE